MRSWIASASTPPTGRAPAARCTRWRCTSTTCTRSSRPTPPASRCASPAPTTSASTPPSSSCAPGTTRWRPAAEVMLLHVRQQGEAARTAPFPPAVAAAIAQLQAASAGMAPAGARVAADGVARHGRLTPAPHERARAAAPARTAQPRADRRRLGGRGRSGEPRHRLHGRGVAHPPQPPVLGDAQHYFRSVDELPAAPDAAFIAAPNREVPAIAAALARRGAGGFVCFAAGFSETATAEGERLTRELLDERRRAAVLRPQLLRLRQLLRRRRAVAGPGGRPAPRARRRPDLPERHASR